jgi:hypothetical protein
MAVTPVIPFEFNAEYNLLDSSNNQIESGNTRLLLGGESLGLKPIDGQTRRFLLREIADISPDDYVVTISLGEAGKVVLSQLGKDYENFFRELLQRRSALLLLDLLMEEPLVSDNTKAAFEHNDDKGNTKIGHAILRLYQTALVVIPEVGTPVRLPFSDISRAVKENYSFHIRTEFGEGFVFSQMGRDLDPFAHTLVDLSQNLKLKAQALAKELMPSSDQMTVLKLGELLKEGRAARRRDIVALGENLWTEFEQQILGSEASEAYKFLQSIGQAQDTCIGVKRGLKEGENDYLWFMVPVYATDPRQPGNAVIMEAVSSDGENRATYAFRLVSRRQYPEMKTPDALQTEFGNFIRTVNRALIAVNFRREPIYITPEMLLQTQYARYRYSIASLPELRRLRWLYIGRVIHSSPEQWQTDVKNLLAFNTGTTDDDAVWSKKVETPVSSGEIP